jgi:hypothetical protein
MNRRVSSGYRRRERLDVVKIIAVLALTAAIGYYGFIGIKCYKHCQELLNNRVSTINFSISG